MDYLDRQGGRFVTVLPRSRLEDAEFRRWRQTHEPTWEPHDGQDPSLSHPAL
jgi:hypothetical protein